MLFLAKLWALLTRSKEPEKNEPPKTEPAKREKVWLPGAPIPDELSRPAFGSFMQRVRFEGFLNEDFDPEGAGWLANDPEDAGQNRLVEILRPSDRKAPQVWIRVNANSERHRNLANVELCGHLLIEKEKSALVCIRPRGFSSSRCPVCGRSLTDPISRTIGLGPRCLKHFTSLNMPRLRQGQTELTPANQAWIKKFRERLKNRESPAVLVTWLSKSDARIERVDGKSKAGGLTQEKIFRLDEPVKRTSDGRWIPGLWGSLLDKRNQGF